MRKVVHTIHNDDIEINVLENGEVFLETSDWSWRLTSKEAKEIARSILENV